MPQKLRGHAYFLYPSSPRPLLDEGVLVIGDAAGLAYPDSGEGIRPAVESGLMAAAVIEAAKGDYRTARLEPYRRMLHERFGSRRPQGSCCTFVPPALNRWLGRTLLANRWFTRRVLLDRRFLHAQQPPLNLDDLWG
jgi:2-polyprenyl-6-methoxyphenol hydroxylase-like FAD-dependent oxidoreductase